MPAGGLGGDDGGTVLADVVSRGDELQLRRVREDYIDIRRLACAAVVADYNPVGTGLRGQEMVGGTAGDNHVVFVPGVGQLCIGINSRHYICEEQFADIADYGVAENDGDRRTLGGEGHLIAVGCTLAVGGIGPDVVRRVGHEACERAGENTCACAVGGVVVADGRGAGGVPTHATGGDGCAAVSSDVAAGGGRGGSDVAYCVGGDGGEGGGDGVVQDAADGKTVACGIVISEHSSILVVQNTIVSSIAITLRRSPEHGTSASIAEIQVVTEASWNHGKTGSISISVIHVPGALKLDVLCQSAPPASLPAWEPRASRVVA